VYRKEPASGSASVSHRPRDFTTPPKKLDEKDPKKLDEKDLDGFH